MPERADAVTPRARVVTFDADGTLWDTWAAIGRGLAAVIDEAARSHPREAAALTAEGLQATRDELAAAPDRPPGEPLGELRARSIAYALSAVGADDPAVAQRCIEAFFSHRHDQVPYPDVVPGLDQLAADGGPTLGLVTNGNTDPRGAGLGNRFAFHLAADRIGLAKPDPRLFIMAATAAGAGIRDLVHVGDDAVTDIAAAQATGARAIWIDRGEHPPPGEAPWPPGCRPDATIADLSDLPGVLAELDRPDPSVGVGPHPEPLPDDDRLDPELLAAGDRRNVADRYRYWHHDAIMADLATSAHSFEVAVENWTDDRNIGTVVRTANAFGVAGVHVVGRRRWNRRGAMVTDRYLTVTHHDGLAPVLDDARGRGLAVIGVDNLPGAEPLERAELPARVLLVFGQEATGLSADARAGVDRVLSIAQYGSTRSINAGVAAGIAMHAWIRAHGGPPPG